MEETNPDPAKEYLKKAGFHIFQERNLTSGKTCLEKALKIQIESLGENNLAVAETFSRIAFVLRSQGKLDESVQKLNKALEIQMDQCFGDHHGSLETADTLVRIGDVWNDKKDYKKAEEMYRQALEMKSHFLPESDPAITQLYQVITTSLRNQDKWSEARSLYEASLERAMEIHGDDYDHIDFIFGYNGLAQALMEENKLDDALEMIEKSHEMCLRLEENEESFDLEILIATLQIQATIQRKRGNLESATELRKITLKIQVEDLGQEMDAGTGQTYYELAGLYMEQQRDQDAVNALTNVVEIYQKVYGKNHPKTKEALRMRNDLSGALNAAKAHMEKKITAQVFLEKANELKAKGDLYKAEFFFQKTVDLSKDICGEHPDTAESLEDLSGVQVDQGKLQEAIASSAEALKIRRRIQGDDHADTKKRMETHRSLLKRLLENR